MEDMSICSSSVSSFSQPIECQFQESEYNTNYVDCSAINNDNTDQGLHMDWLVRAQCVQNIETMVYLSQQQQKWADEDSRKILSILQTYEDRKLGLKECNTPKPYSKRRSHEGRDPEEVFEFNCRLLELVKQETVIWDKINDEQFGLHQKMREAWCNISLKLGGWGTMQHVHMLKQLYRRKRDQYNIEYLRARKPFQYHEQMDFLKNVLEMTNSGDQKNAIVNIRDHINAVASDLDYDNELTGAPIETQFILNTCSELIEKVRKMYGDEAFVEYMKNCCRDVVQNREDLATEGLRDGEWHHESRNNRSSLRNNSIISIDDDIEEYLQ